MIGSKWHRLKRHVKMTLTTSKKLSHQVFGLAWRCAWQTCTWDNLTHQTQQVSLKLKSATFPTRLGPRVRRWHFWWCWREAEPRAKTSVWESIASWGVEEPIFKVEVDVYCCTSSAWPGDVTEPNDLVPVTWSCSRWAPLLILSPQLLFQLLLHHPQVLKGHRYGPEKVKSDSVNYLLTSTATS